jgi:selenide,water dikinase
MNEEIKLTTLTKGGGCGCKIPPATLKEILKGQLVQNRFGLLVGNATGDDAAIYDLGNGECLISTTDFFTPIVDDPYDFGRIAAANSISDVYAMGGRPIMALSILAWPTDKIPSEIASEVIRGASSVCEQVGIAIAGGHSIENPEPVFGLMVNGLSRTEYIKRNNSAQPGDVLFLTKPLGSGILATAMKRNLLSVEQINELVDELVKLNRIGQQLGQIPGVHAMTDITGFGLIGHLLEMTDAADLSAEINYEKVPLMNSVKDLAAKYIYADNTMRNWKHYNERVSGISGESLLTLCDPQTNGGLLVAVGVDAIETVEELFKSEGQFYAQIGEIRLKEEHQIIVS